MLVGNLQLNIQQAILSINQFRQKPIFRYLTYRILKKQVTNERNSKIKITHKKLIL
jgi:hypothetical protein